MAAAAVFAAVAVVAGWQYMDARAARQAAVQSAGTAVVERGSAEQQRQLAEERRKDAEEQRGAARQRQGDAEEQRGDRPATAASGGRAAVAGGEAPPASRGAARSGAHRAVAVPGRGGGSDVRAGDEMTAVLLALEALPDEKSGSVRPLVSEAEPGLDRALRGRKDERVPREAQVLSGHARRTCRSGPRVRAQRRRLARRDGERRPRRAGLERPNRRKHRRAAGACGRRRARFLERGRRDDRVGGRGRPARLGRGGRRAARIASPATKPDRRKRRWSGDHLHVRARIASISGTGQAGRSSPGPWAATSWAFVSARKARACWCRRRQFHRGLRSGERPAAARAQGALAKPLNAAFSPDGQRIASIGDDQTARIWSLADGTQLFFVIGPQAQAVMSRFDWAPSARSFRLRRDGGFTRSTARGCSRNCPAPTARPRSRCSARRKVDRHGVARRRRLPRWRSCGMGRAERTRRIGAGGDDHLRRHQPGRPAASDRHPRRGGARLELRSQSRSGGPSAPTARSWSSSARRMSAAASRASSARRLSSRRSRRPGASRWRSGPTTRRPGKTGSGTSGRAPIRRDPTPPEWQSWLASASAVRSEPKPPAQ